MELCSSYTFKDLSLCLPGKSSSTRWWQSNFEEAIAGHWFSSFYISLSLFLFCPLLYTCYLLTGGNLWVVVLGSWKRRFMVHEEEGMLVLEHLWSLVKEEVFPASAFHMDYLTLFVSPPPHPITQCLLNIWNGQCVVCPYKFLMLVFSLFFYTFKIFIFLNIYPEYFQ